MKIHQPLRCLAGAALVIAAVTTTTLAQSWETVDVFQVPTKRWNQARCVAVDSLGRLFVAGYVSDDGPAMTLVLRRSLDRGASWQTVFTLDDNYPDGADKFKVLSGTGGQVFVVAGIGKGGWQDGPDAMHWLVYRSDDGGDSWAIKDDFVLTPGYPSQPFVAASDSSGAIYVAGLAFPTPPGADGYGRPVLRRSTDGGQTWTTHEAPGLWDLRALAATPQGLFAVGPEYSSGVWTVWRSTDSGDNWDRVDSYPSGQTPMPVGVTSDGHGNLLVVGSGYDNSGYHSIVRQSSDGGDTWSTVGDYQSSPTAVAADAAGGLWVVGHDLTVGWLVGHSGDAGVSWADSDHYRLDPSASSLARSVAVDMAGNVFVAGQSRATTNGVDSRFWIVRKLAGAPQLSLAPANGQLRVVWPTNATGFVLQSAPTLTNGGDWQDSLLSATESNGQKVVTLTPTGARGFFRLRGP